MMLACEQGHLEVVQALFFEGASADVMNFMVRLLTIGDALTLMCVNQHSHVALLLRS